LARFKLAKRGNKRHPDKLLGILKSIKEDLTKRPGQAEEDCEGSQ
jgi:hypothetical protein